MLIKFEYNTTSPLLEAYLKGDFDQFNNLVNSGENINFIKKDGNSLICIIIINGNKIDEKENKKFFDLLLESGVHLDKVENYVSPLICSMLKNDDIYYMQQLLKNNVEINYELFRNGYGDFHYKYPPIFSAVKCCPMDKIELLLEYNPDLTIKDGRMSSVLHELIEADNKNWEALFLMFLSKGADPNALNLEQDSVLHKISYGNIKWQNDYKKLFSILLDNNANIEIKNKSGCTPLHNACKGGNLTIFDILIKLGASITETNNDNSTCAMLAAEYKRYAILDALEQKGVDFSVQDEFDENVCHKLARTNGQSERKISILKKHYKLLLVKNIANNTPLDIVKISNVPLYNELREFVEKKEKSNLTSNENLNVSQR